MYVRHNNDFYHFSIFTGFASDQAVILKHSTTLFSLSDHDILSREWRVIVDQVQTSYHGRPIIIVLLSVGALHS